MSQDFDLITKIVSDFCTENPKLATRRGSFNRCAAVCQELAARLDEHGHRTEFVQLSDGTKYYPDADKRWHDIGASCWWVHYVLRVDDTIIDCTGRQFDPTCDFPAITSVSDVLENWDEAIVVKDLKDRWPLKSLRAEMKSVGP